MESGAFSLLRNDLRYIEQHTATVRNLTASTKILGRNPERCCKPRLSAWGLWGMMLRYEDNSSINKSNNNSNNGKENGNYYYRFCCSEFGAHVVAHGRLILLPEVYPDMFSPYKAAARSSLAAM